MAASEHAPNILIVTIDAVRRDHCSLYGYERPTTPHMERIAERGTVFENAIADSGWTAATVGSLFTGLCAGEHGVDPEHSLPEGIPTVAERLRDTGYHTAGFSTNPMASPLFGHGRGFDHFWYWERWSARTRLGAPLRYLGTRLGLSDMGGADMLKALSKHVRSCPKPVFGYVHFNEAHSPYGSVRAYERMFLARNTSWRDVRDIARKTGHIRIYDFGETATDEEIELVKALYDASICYQDMLLGKLVAFLQQHAPNTVIIVTADHGEAFAEEQAFGHNFCLEETQIRVPLVMAGPDITAGEQVNTLVQTRDIAQTVCAIAGAEELAETVAQRIDLREVSGAERKYAYALRTAMSEEKAAEHREKLTSFDVDEHNRLTTCIRSDRFKLTRKAGAGTVLQDVAGHPFGGPDCTSDHPVLAAEMQRSLSQWEQAQLSRQTDASSDVHIDDPLVKERLRGLGYMA